MLNQQLIINTPPAKSTAVRNDPSAGAANSNGQTSDTFGSVLAKHIEDTRAAAKSAKPSGTQDNTKPAQSTAADGQTTQDQSTATAPAADATSIALATMLLGNHQNKAPVTHIKSQDKAPATTTSPDTAAIVAGMFGNQSAAQPVANEASTSRMVGIDPVAEDKRMVGIDPVAGNKKMVGIDPVADNKRMAGIDPVISQNASARKNINTKADTATSKTSNLTGSATPHKPGMNATRDNPSITVSSKTETALQSPLKSGTGIESAKSTDSAVVLANTTPSAQMMSDSASALITTGLSPDKATNTANTVSNTIAAPLGSSAWPAEFAQKVNWMSTQQNQVAELHLNPPDLGPMSVVLSISDNQATAVFSSPHSAVRDAIENAMPKLRESLAENGIMLGNATVNDQAPRDNGASNFMNQRENARVNLQTDDAGTSTAPTSLPVMSPSRHNGMVDTFA